MSLDLTFALNQVKFKYIFYRAISYNDSAILHCPRISHKMICVIPHSPKKLHSTMLVKSNGPRIPHKQLSDWEILKFCRCRGERFKGNSTAISQTNINGNGSG